MDFSFRIEAFNPPLTTHFIAQAVGAHLNNVRSTNVRSTAVRSTTSHLINGVTTDSRLVQKGDCFIALRGDRGDGHAHIASAIRQGAICVIGEIGHMPEQESANTLFLPTPDSLFALGELAKSWRQQFRLPLLGITGSNGKTTTKEIAMTLLEGAGETLSSYGNWNNLIGLPLTLLRLRPEHSYGVLEMGMNHFGEIARLCEIANPDYRLITNIMPVHLEGVGDLDGVARAKAEMVHSIAPQQHFIVNADDPRLVKLASQLQCQLWYYSKAPQSSSQPPIAVRLINKTELEIAKQRYPFTLSLGGEHNLSNMLAAVTAGLAIGLDPLQMTRCLAQVKPPPLRSQWLNLDEGIRIYNDCYNANPGSVQAALEFIKQQKAPRHIAVLGDMWELGNSSLKLHQEILQLTQQLQYDLVLCLGPNYQAAVPANPSNTWLRTYAHIDALNQELGVLLRPQDLVLVKGSRAMKMERVVEHLQTLFTGKMEKGI